MKYNEVCQNIMSEIVPETTALQMVQRLSSQVLHFAIEELRTSPPAAFRATMNRDEVKVRIEDLKNVLHGKDDLDWALLAEFNFEIVEVGRLAYQVKMCRTGNSTHNWPNKATFDFSLEQFTPNSEKKYIAGTRCTVLTAREQFQRALTNDTGVQFRSKPMLFSFLNFFTTSPEAMLRHGYMLMDDVDNPAFCGVHIKPIKKKGTDIVKGISLKFLHLTKDPRPELYIAVSLSHETHSGIAMYDMRGAEDYDTSAT